MIKNTPASNDCGTTSAHPRKAVMNSSRSICPTSSVFLYDLNNRLDTVARRLFRSYKKTLLVGQMLLLLFMTAFLGWAEVVPQSLLAGVFFIIGVAVSSGVMIYPIIRSMF